MKKSFDNYWEQVHSRTEWGQYPTEHVIRFIARNYYNKNRKEIRILDIRFWMWRGCSYLVFGQRRI